MEKEEEEDQSVQSKMLRGKQTRFRVIHGEVQVAHISPAITINI